MVQWMKDGRVIDDDSVEPNDNVYASDMTLSNINASNAGIYDCTAIVGSKDGSTYIMNSNEISAVGNISIMLG